MNESVSARDHPVKQFIRRSFMLSPEAVARHIVRATVKRRREVILSLPAKAIARVNAICPGVLDRLFARLEGRQ